MARILIGGSPFPPPLVTGGFPAVTFHWRSAPCAGSVAVMNTLFLLAAALSSAVITPDNVQRLEVAWTYDTHDSTEPFTPGGKPPGFEMTPAYADGQLYVSSPQGTVA